LSERSGLALRGARTLVIGIAYKKNIDDSRESPALKIMELLDKRGAAVSFHDPFFPEIPPTREHAALSGRCSIALSPASLAATDVALICTDHDAIDYRMLADHCPLIIDTRNAFASRGIASDKVVKA
jgi:UDP-N-acetyl-D-glucosamine dehydrogenase